MSWVPAIIGGSGLQGLAGEAEGVWRTVETPWGAPSDAVFDGVWAGRRFLFLPRHGRGHRIAPGEINARANVDALKRLGATDVVAVSAVGSLRENRAPGHFSVVDQIIDGTRRRESFFGTGCVAHVSFADPVCPRLSALVHAAAKAAGAVVHEGGCYLAMEGPAFSTRAESRLYRQWGADVIGMTAIPEARLCREAELPYALLALATDYDSWREGKAVDVAEVVARLGENAALARRTVEALLAGLPAEREGVWIDTCLDHAIITAPGARDAGVMARLDAVAGRVLRRNAAQ